MDFDLPDSVYFGFPPQDLEVVEGDIWDESAPSSVGVFSPLLGQGEVINFAGLCNIQQSYC